MIELVAGGARSGKSRYALEAAESSSASPIFVATATAGDSAMAERIRRHRAERGDQWRLVEEPLRLSQVVKRFSKADVAVVDCLTLWLSNWLTGENAAGWPAEKTAALSALRESDAHIYLVTNEVGMGVVPMGTMSREFVDESGWLHQEIAALADRVTLMHFGLPLQLKDQRAM